MEEWVIITCENDWYEIENLSNLEFNEFLNTINNDEQCLHLQKETERKGIEILKEEMKQYYNFYTFIRNFSPIDHKIIKGIPHISQRVIGNHYNMWKEIHPYSHLNKLNIFQL